MNLEIHYEAGYRYEKPVSFSPHVVRIFPRPGAGLLSANSHFECSVPADIMYGRDLYDNPIATCFFPETTAELHLRLHARLEIEEKDPFRFLLNERGTRIPPDYTEVEQSALGAFLTPVGGPDFPAPLAAGESAPSVETLTNLLRWTHENFRYERRESGEPYSAGEFLRRGAGACRDFAVFFTEVLRRRGVATRFVSGYLWEECDAAERVAEGALHAWVEAYLPGAGWLALDPTNGVFCDHHAIAAAVGAAHADVAPLTGTYYAREAVPGDLSSTLTIRNLPPS